MCRGGAKAAHEIVEKVVSKISPTASEPVARPKPAHSRRCSTKANASARTKPTARARGNTTRGIADPAASTTASEPKPAHSRRCSTKANDFGVDVAGFAHGGTSLSQSFDAFGMIGPKRFTQRGVSPAIFAVDVDFAGDEIRDHDRVAFSCSQVQRSALVVIPRIQVVLGTK